MADAGTPPEAPGRGAVGKWALAARRFASPRRLRRTARWLAEGVGAIRRRRATRGLTVAVDVNSFYEPLTGVGWYLHQLLTHLADVPGLRLRLYGQSLVEGDPGAPVPVVVLPAGPAIERVTWDAPDGLVVPPWRARQLLRRLAPLLVAADGNRVLFAPNFIPPRLFRFARGARVATVHDLTLQRLPEAARPDTATALLAGLERTLLTAGMLITPSEAVRQELLTRGVAAGRVRAVHHGPGQLAALTPGELPAGTPPAYVLYVGTLEPRKNLPMLLAAWRLLRRRLPGAPPLLLCGRWGWHGEELQPAVAAGTAEGWLVHLGYVPAPQLAALYRGALLLVLPSLYEGFGLPVVEAFAAGIPALLSDLPVLREVAGEAALFAPAGDPEAWAAALARLLGDATLRRELAARGNARAAAFDWRRAAAATAAVWSAAAAREGREAADILRAEAPTS
jgi:alpha-1,3-rhamnosyl/mannosyltransferase